jgi:hypothetical protein
MSWFTVVQKRQEKKEFYPNEAVLVQASYDVETKGSKTKFIFSETALRQLGYEPNTPSVNKVTFGYDENNNLVLVAYDAEHMHTSNITAENSFSNQKFMDKLVKDFNIDPVTQHVFDLNIVEKDSIFAAYLSLRKHKESCIVYDEPYEGYNAAIDKVFEEEREKSGISLF